MKRHALLVVLCAAACKRGAGKPPAPSPGSQAPAVKPAVAADAAPAKDVPRDPRIAALFQAGSDCTWNDIGLATCDAADKIKQLAFENQNDDQLAASCLAALHDPAPTTRGLAAVCLGGFTDRTRTPLMGAALDAFAAEKDPKLRHAIAWAFSSDNASEGGVEPRVIALVRQLVAAGDDDAAASWLDSMFPQYMMQTTPPPSKDAGDLALELARKAGPHTQTRALEDVGLLVDRKADVCAALGDAVKTAQWSPAIETMTKFPAECARQLDTAIDVVAAKMIEGDLQPAMTLLVDRVALTRAQVAKLAPAAKKMVAKVPDWQRKNARELARRLDPYHPPAQK